MARTKKKDGRRYRPGKRNKLSRAMKAVYAAKRVHSSGTECDGSKAPPWLEEARQICGKMNEDLGVMVLPSDSTDEWTDIDEGSGNSSDSDLGNMDVDDESLPDLNIEYHPPEITLKDILPGRRVVNVAHLLSQLEAISQHSHDCTTGRFVLRKEVKNGLHCTWHYHCGNCNQTRYVTSEEPNESIDVNKSLVWGALSTGIGFAQVEELMGLIDVPIMTSKSFRKEEQHIEKSWEEHLAVKMKLAGEEERRIAIQKGHFLHGIPYISVIGDGGWAKRTYGHGYNSLSGVGAIIGAETKKLLYLGIKNAFCSSCSRAKIKGKGQPRDHVCYKNYRGPATGMEQSIIVEGFRQSEAMHGVLYKMYVGDGDSSVYTRIQEQVPYGRYVLKVECANHVTRAYNDNMHKLSTNTMFPITARRLLTAKEDGISRLERLVKGIRCAITDSAIHKSVELLRTDIRNAPYHVFGCHLNCRDSYCKRKERQEENLIPELQKTKILASILKETDVVVRKADRLTLNQTTNVAERFMGIVAKFVGGKRVNFTQHGGYRRRCVGAALSHTSGPGWHASPWRRMMGRSPGQIFQRHCARRERVRALRCLRYSDPNRPKRIRKKKGGGPDSEYGPEAAGNTANITEEDIDDQQLHAAMDKILADLSTTCDTKIKCDNLERSTVGQHVNQKWRDARLNRITASHFGEVVRRKKKTPCHNLVKKILIPRDLNTEAVTFGRVHEGTAIKLLEEKTGVLVESCGLFVNSQYPYLGASPDGLIGSDALVEVKCLPSVGDRDLKDVAREKRLCVEVKDGILQLRRSHQYYYQIQGQLNICKRHKCYFVVYTGGNDVFVEIIMRDNDFWQNTMLPNLRTFYMDCVLPEIANSRISRGLRVREPNCDNGKL